MFTVSPSGGNGIDIGLIVVGPGSGPPYTSTLLRNGVYVPETTFPALKTAINGSHYRPFNRHVPSMSVRACAASGTRAVAFGDVTTPYYTNDGITWSAGTPSAITGQPVWDAFYANGLFLAGGGAAAATTAQTLQSSADGAIWTARTAAIANSIFGFAYGSAKFVAVGAPVGNNNVQYSANGTTGWTAVAAGVAATLHDVVFAAALFVAVGTAASDAGLYTSPDGITWTPRVSPVGCGTAYSVCHDGTYFLVLTSSGQVLSSADGVTWVSLHTIADNIFYTTNTSLSTRSRLRYEEGVYRFMGIQVVGANYVISAYETADFTRWRVRPLYTATQTNFYNENACRWVLFGGKMFVGGNGMFEDNPGYVGSPSAAGYGSTTNSYIKAA